MYTMIKRLVVSSVMLLMLDYIYLSYNRHEMEMQVVNIQRVVMQLKLVPTVLCYLLLIGGLNYFILSRQRPIHEAVLLGLLIYGVYDTTSLAIYKKYKWNIALQDTLWGGALFGLTTAVVYAFPW
jgi:uncharacterized membrane protein